MQNSQIMIVEDEGLIALEIKECLEHLGYSVSDIVDNGKDAITKAIQFNPDLILMDINLRDDIDGIEAARQINDISKIPIIYLTAYSEDKTMERAKETTPYNYLLKPIDEKSLNFSIQMALHRAGKEKERVQESDLLYSILKSIGNGVIVHDSEGTVKFCNAEAEEIIHYAGKDLSRLKLFEHLSFVESETGKELELSLMDVLIDGEVYTYNDVLLTCKDGSEEKVVLTLAPLRSESGIISDVVMIMNKTGGKVITGKPESISDQNIELVVTYMEIEIIRLLLAERESLAARNAANQGKIAAYKDIYRKIKGTRALQDLMRRIL